jgi:hypothetical protein
LHPTTNNTNILKQLLNLLFDFLDCKFTQFGVKQLVGLVDLFSKPPPQFEQTLCNTVSTHSLQNVHSWVQIIASLLLFGNDFALVK